MVRRVNRTWVAEKVCASTLQISVWLDLVNGVVELLAAVSACFLPFAKTLLLDHEEPPPAGVIP